MNGSSGFPVGQPMAGSACFRPWADPKENRKNQKIREVADTAEANGEVVVAGGGRRLPERSIPTPGGDKQSRRPDVILQDQAGNERGVNVGRTKADGTPVTREVKALKDLNGPGNLPTTFEPYD